MPSGSRRRSHSPPVYLQLQKRYITLATGEEEQLSEWKHQCQLRLKQVSAPNMVPDDSDWRLCPAGDGTNHLPT